MEQINNRPIILISNSSWYLFHYRKLLIKKIKETRSHILALAPYDTTSVDLSKLLIHIPWRMSRAKDQNLYSFLISFLRMLLLIRAIKPKLIHSHTLQANLITSIISSFFGINCVLSFAGIGKFSKSKGIAKLFFKLIFKTIYIFNSYQRNSRFTYSLNTKRSAFIFQNEADINFINNEICEMKETNYYLIHGSGVPNIYISQSKKFRENSQWLNKKMLSKNKRDFKKDINFIYCARLLRTKGILIFLELSRFYPENKFLIFGSSDSSSKDSLSKEEILYFKKIYKNVKFMDNKRDPLLTKKITMPILIVPSIYGEGFPRGILEANTLSIPVIASKESSSKIPIKDLFYTSNGNSKIDYVNSIKKVIEDYKNKKLENKLNLARKKSIKYFSEEIIVKKTLNIYKSFDFEKNKSYLLNKDKIKLKDWIAQ